MTDEEKAAFFSVAQNAQFLIRTVDGVIPHPEVTLLFAGIELALRHGWSVQKIQEFAAVFDRPSDQDG